MAVDLAQTYCTQKLFFVCFDDRANKYVPQETAIVAVPGDAVRDPCLAQDPWRSGGGLRQAAEGLCYEGLCYERSSGGLPGHTSRAPTNGLRQCRFDGGRQEFAQCLCYDG